MYALYYKMIQVNGAVLRIYTSYLAENDLLAARQYLLAQTNPDAELSDFITVQLIHLDRLDVNWYYQGSAAELDAIKTIAESAILMQDTPNRFITG